MASPPTPKVSRCTHISTIGDNSWEDVFRKKAKQETCETCQAQVSNLWLCLYDQCLYVGCGEGHQDHSSVHADASKHCLTLNTTTMRIWCYLCEGEVYKEANIPTLILRTGSKSQVNKSPRGKDYMTDTRLPEDSEESAEDEDLNKRPRGLTGLYNTGNTCYMNAALQCLSNCPPLMRFFLDCDGFIPNTRRLTLSKSYRKLVTEMWHYKRPSYVTPSEISQGVKHLHPMFKGYTQQDSQEFLRCFMDDLHEELKQPLPLRSTDNDINEECDSQKRDVHGDNVSTSSDTYSGYVSSDTVVPLTGGSSAITLATADSGLPRSLSAATEVNTVSDTEYETCDSGTGSEHNLSDASSTDSRQYHNDLEPQVHGSPPRSGVTPARSGHSRTNSGASSMHRRTGSGVELLTAKQKKDCANQASKQKSTTSPSSGDTDTFSDAVSEMDFPHKQIPNTMNSGMTQKRKHKQYQSVISDVFDGRINSSVQCLTCERVSSTRETFQDLSLPIPGKDHLHVLHASQGGVVPNQQAMHSAVTVAASAHKGTCGEVSLKQTWLGWMFGWMKSWLMGPTVTLQDCLAAFFSADDLKGDNMYSCEKCKKLRNGVKFSKVLKLPEVLCIHLKRFRHEFMYSSKIGSYVTFPLEGLDMTPYLHKDCADQVPMYDLVSVICHHGTAGGGHYTSYGLNHVNLQWYEFDDQCVTEVDMQAVENCEAYVLFYRKRNEGMMKLRQKASELMQSPQTSMMNFYISKQWINRFNTFAEPGPITNYDFLCRHGGIAPEKVTDVSAMVLQVSSELWQLLHNKYGGGPAVNHIYHCSPCQREKDKLLARQKFEKDRFVQLYQDFQTNGNPAIYAISLAWFKQWEMFIEDKVTDPPGPIDNNKISHMINGQAVLRVTADYGQISEDTWTFLHDIYTGGPEIITKQRTTTLLQQQQQMQSTTQDSNNTTTAQTHYTPEAQTTAQNDSENNVEYSDDCPENRAENKTENRPENKTENRTENNTENRTENKNENRSQNRIENVSCTGSEENDSEIIDDTCDKIATMDSDKSSDREDFGNELEGQHYSRFRAL